MSLVTLFQFLFVSMEGLYFGGFLIVRPRDTSTHPSLRGYIPKEALGKQSLIHWLVPFEVELKPRVIPLYQWFVTVLMFWTVSIMTNAALSYKVDMPLHILFKSGGLLVNMVAGYLWLGKRYTSDQLFSVCLVTVG